MTMLAATFATLVLLVVIVATTLMNGRQTSFDLGFHLGYRVQSRGWWLWQSYDLYATIQYTYRGVPVGQPVERLVKSVSKVEPEAIRQVLEMAASMASGAPANLLGTASRAAASRMVTGRSRSAMGVRVASKTGSPSRNS